MVPKGRTSQGKAGRPCQETAKGKGVKFSSSANLPKIAVLIFEPGKSTLLLMLENCSVRNRDRNWALRIVLPQILIVHRLVDHGLKGQV